MNENLIAKYVGVAVYAIFIGAQITEGALLVPYWQSLSAEEFYDYYAQFGPLIGRFYTILTIVASLIPVFVAARYIAKKNDGVKLAIVSAVLAILVIACFYVYFKSANGEFYARAFDEMSLQKELVVWSYWHWGRIVLEIGSLMFLMLALVKARKS